MRQITGILLGTALLSACSYPTTTVNQGAVASSLYVPSAPADAVLWIDGVNKGLASTYNGKKKARYPISAGRHRVKIVGTSGTLVEKDIYVEAGASVAVEVLP